MIDNKDFKNYTLKEIRTMPQRTSVALPDGLDRDQIICLMKFGSHLYGTNTTDSDTDYKGVYMPTKRQILLGKCPKQY